MFSINLPWKFVIDIERGWREPRPTNASVNGGKYSGLATPCILPMHHVHTHTHLCLNVCVYFVAITHGSRYHARFAPWSVDRASIEIMGITRRSWPTSASGRQISSPDREDRRTYVPEINYCESSLRCYYISYNNYVRRINF